MSEHTPGPWGWLPSDNGKERWVLQGWCGAKGQGHEGLNHSLNECGVLILSCECPFPDTPNSNDYRPTEANARLIAAAPELLRQLCKMVEIVKVEREASGIYKAHLAEAEAAIAKAQE